MTLLDHVHEFDALQGHSGRTKGVESEHRPDDSFHRPMILFHPIIQVLDLTDLNGGTRLLLECIQGRGIGPALDRS